MTKYFTAALTVMLATFMLIAAFCWMCELPWWTNTWLIAATAYVVGYTAGFFYTRKKT